MKVLQSGYFSRALKRLHRQEKELLDQAVKFIINSPEAGELKTGDLAGVRVYKFKVNLDRMLLTYQYDRESAIIMLLAYGFHKNFYRDLKKLI